RSVADALDFSLGAIDRDCRGNAALARPQLRERAVLDEPHAAPQICVLKQRPDVGGAELLPGAVGNLLHDYAELDLQSARQVEAVIGFHHVSDTALARLAVDPNDRFVG